MVNKLYVYLLLLCTAVQLHAQEIQGAPVAADTVVFKEQPADTATVAAIAPTDTAVTIVHRQFENGFKEKYKSADFVYEKKAAAKSLWERFVTWLGEVLDDIFSFGEGTRTAPAYAVVIRLLLALVLLFVVYLIVKAIVNKEGNFWIFGKSGKKINVYDAAVEDIHQMDFKSLVEETKRTGDYRHGVRYYYLWLLKKLSNREIIEWHWDKTNTDYIYEIKDSSLRKDFEYMSYIYDYSWYGEFSIDEAAFAKAEKAFTKILNTL